MKVWITKYALTEGILEREATLSKTCDTLIQVDKLHGEFCTQFYSQPHWHQNHQDAVKQAEVMRERKLKSLRKSIEKIQKLKFE